MSVGPSLGDLFSVVRLLDQEVHSETSLKELLEQIMPILLPEARAMRVYRLSGNRALWLAGTVAGSDVELGEGSPYQAAIMRRKPVQSAGLWITPLHIGGDIFGLMEVETAPTLSAPDQMSDLLNFAAHLLSPTLQRAFIHSRDLAMRDADDALSLAHAQYEASGTIFGSESPVETLKSINSFTGGVFERSHLGLLETQSGLSHLHIVAESDSSGVRPANYYRLLDEYPAFEALVALEALTVQDVEDDEFLTESERQRLQQQGIRSLVIVPLVVSQRLTGLIMFSHSLPISLSPARLRALRNLGDQLAIVLENRALLRRTAQTLEEVRTLYDINRALIGAGNPLDILSLLRTYLAHDAAAITYTQVRRAIDGSLEDLVREYTVTPSGEDSEPISLISWMDRAQVSELDEFLQGYEETLELDDDVSANGESPLSLVAKVPGTKAYVSLIIRDDLEVREIISILFDSPRSFDERTRRLYEAVADQIAIVRQNQRLVSDSHRRAEQLQRIASFGQAVQQTFDVGQIVRTMMQESAQTVPVDRMNIALHDPVQNALRVVAQYEDGVSSVVLTGGPILSTRGAYIGRVWESGEFLYVPDVLMSTDMRRAQEAEIRSLMIAPIRVRDRLLGIVNIGSLHPNAYTETDIAVFQQMVNQLATALENAEAFAHSQRVAKNEALINDISAQLQQQMDMQRMLNVTLNELGAALGARRGRIRLQLASDGGVQE